LQQVWTDGAFWHFVMGQSRALPCPRWLTRLRYWGAAMRLMRSTFMGCRFDCQRRQTKRRGDYRQGRKVHRMGATGSQERPISSSSAA